MGEQYLVHQYIQCSNKLQFQEIKNKTMIYVRSIKSLYFFIYIILVNNVLWASTVISTNTSNYQHIESLVNKYTIGVTVLEIANSEDTLYSFELAKMSNCVCIILLMNYGANSVIQRIKKDNIKNIIVLEPRDLDGQMINALSKCEHIDVSIVHDYFEHFQSFWKSTADLFLNLGNHVFFEIDYDHATDMLSYKNPQLRMIENRFNKLLFYYQTEKKFLEIARFTQFNKARSYTQNYEIKSDFNEKLLLKKNPETITPWIAGINLITFVMMRGVYPTDDIIRSEIINIEKAYPYHNDLILGNMVIQGHTIIPIDFNDKRRSASMPKMLTRAINFFNGDNWRLKNPAEKINKYYKNPKKK